MSISDAALSFMSFISSTGRFPDSIWALSLISSSIFSRTCLRLGSLRCEVRFVNQTVYCLGCLTYQEIVLKVNVPFPQNRRNLIHDLASFNAVFIFDDFNIGDDMRVRFGENAFQRAVSNVTRGRKNEMMNRKLHKRLVISASMKQFTKFPFHGFNETYFFLCP